jgi:hypothetical protein
MAIETDSPDEGAVGVADIDLAAGRDHDPVALAVLRRVVHRKAAAQDVDAVVRLPEQSGVIGLSKVLANSGPGAC